MVDHHSNIIVKLQSNIHHCILPQQIELREYEASIRMSWGIFSVSVLSKIFKDILLKDVLFQCTFAPRHCLPLISVSHFLPSLLTTNWSLYHSCVMKKNQPKKRKKCTMITRIGFQAAVNGNFEWMFWGLCPLVNNNLCTATRLSDAQGPLSSPTWKSPVFLFNRHHCS